MTALVAAQSAVLLLLCVLVAGLLRSHATILRRLHELGAGVEPGGARAGVESPVAVTPRPPGDRPTTRRAHDVSGVDLEDAAVVVPVVGVGHDTLLAFLSSGCSTCTAFWDAFAAGVPMPAGARLVVVTRDAAEEQPSLLAAMAAPGLPLVLSSRAWDDYQVPGSPYVVLVDGERGEVVGEGTAPSFEQVLSLLGRAVEDADHRSALEARRGRKAAADAARERLIDEELLAAGVAPGDPSLYRPVDEEEPSP